MAIQYAGRGIQCSCSHSYIRDDVFFVWYVTGTFLRVWRFLCTSCMDTWTYRRKCFFGWSISGRYALFYLLHGYIIWYPRVQQSPVFAGNPRDGAAFCGICPDEGSVSLALYAVVCAYIVFDT